MAKKRFTPIKNETVLVEARVGKKILGIYCILFSLLFIFGGGLLSGGILGYVKGMPKMISTIIIGIALILLILPVAGHYISTKNRRYVLTDKRIVIIKGGKMKRSNRSLSLKSIQGVEKNNNMIYNWFGLATIDFYALAVASNTTKMKIFSFSSTNFKFQWVDKKDADAVYAYMQNYLVNGNFTEQTFDENVQNDFIENDDK